MNRVEWRRVESYLFCCGIFASEEDTTDTGNRPTRHLGFAQIALSHRFLLSHTSRDNESWIETLHTRRRNSFTTRRIGIAGQSKRIGSFIVFLRKGARKRSLSTKLWAFTCISRIDKKRNAICTEVWAAAHQSHTCKWTLSQSQEGTTGVCRRLSNDA
jgi:hypothetical protein